MDGVEVVTKYMYYVHHIIFCMYPNVKIMPSQINNVHDNHIKIYIFSYVPEGNNIFFIKRFTIKHM